ncbi:MAG: DEDD exonuclease domain-containing protein [Acidimicrobiia bacterium]|nr:DEDD exonuclease domain-containing protein [Acidimicrobiia bacterium]
MLEVQRSLDDLGTPLADATFVVVDLETTGTSPRQSAITEIGAVRFRGGELLGTFRTLVNPGVPIPPMITVLTGITEAMVRPAPSIEAVLPSLLEFLDVRPGGPAPACVLVGHNVRFDAAFLDAALEAHGYGRLPHRRVDTLALARRLLRDEVPNLRLATLGDQLRTPHRPSHRALDDALATADVLHALLERAGTLGVLGLDDLLELPTIRAHPAAAKLSLTAGLPRKPGVYLFRDAGGRVLYVGKATNLRARVRSYFSSDDRRKVPQLLRETATIDHLVSATPLEAEVRELRLIQRHEPRFNRRAKAWRSYAYLKLTLAERFPRLATVRTVRDDGGLYLGPLPSAGAARAVQEAIESAAPLRRCTRRLGRRLPTACDAPCLPAQLGVAACPCSGDTGEEEYASVVAPVAAALRGDPRPLLEPLERRMHALAGDERFEEAAATRDRLSALVRTLTRQRILEQVVTAGRIVARGPEGTIEIVGGRLRLDGEEMAPLEPGRPVPREAVDEVLALGRWLERAGRAGRVHLDAVAGRLASPLPRLPRLRPVALGRAPPRSLIRAGPAAHGGPAGLQRPPALHEQVHERRGDQRPEDDHEHEQQVPAQAAAAQEVEQVGAGEVPEPAGRDHDDEQPDRHRHEPGEERPQLPCPRPARGRRGRRLPARRGGAGYDRGGRPGRGRSAPGDVGAAPA